MTESYKLRASLIGHTMDVRGVTAGITEGGKEYIVSSSRDRTTKIWIPSEDGNFEVFQSCEGHTNFVSCVCLLPPSPKHPSGLILTGGHDHTILAFELGNPKPLFHLASHKGTVCSIAATSDSLLVSGSWDQTAKVWSEQENIATLTGHTAAVWAVATIPGKEHRVLTGSADKEIRLWVNYKTKTIFKGHTDCVRALAVVDSNRFLSGANDASIRLWDVTQGETINTFYGHSNYIYSMALLPNCKDFVSVGEDRTLRIWKGDNCAQVIHLPALSIWSVAVLKNGDVVTGSSDGVVRIFTNEPDRMASIDALVDFEDQVSNSTIAAQQELGGLKVSELPGTEALSKPGKKDGETKMIREKGAVACYSWSVADQKWTKVGDVVGASGATQNTSGRVLHDGKEYDYVFSVELDDKTTCKLPFNITEDPWFAAQKFIEKNNLSQSFLDQVANFIISNTKGVQLGTASSEYADPFTGGNRYVPGSGSTSQGAGAGGGVDPFTGAGAYRTDSAPAPMDTSESLGPPCFPITEYLRFPQLPNSEALKGKLTEFIQSLGDEAGVGDGGVQDLLRIGTTNEWDDDLNKIFHICLKQWPQDKIFPILDLLRVGVLKPGLAHAMNKVKTFEPILENSLSQENSTNQMLVLRTLCNLFGTENGFLMSKQSEIISKILTNISKGKNNQVAAATLLLNYSILVTGREAGTPEVNVLWSNVETQTEILMGTISLIEILDEPEGAYRLLVGLGNLISDNKNAAELFKSLGGDSLVANYSKNGALSKIKECAQQLLARLH